jgi:conjugative transfer signal peptidase TraF
MRWTRQRTNRTSKPPIASYRAVPPATPSKPGRFLAFLFLSQSILTILAVAAGLRINHTASFPVGFYWCTPKHPAKGDLVLFRPPPAPVFDLALERGYIGPGGLERYECMLKRIIAAGGDTVTIDAAGVTVNGCRLPNSFPHLVDLAGRPMPSCRLESYRLSPGEVLLMSESLISFDGRYFGPIAQGQIQTVVQPVWTW